MGTKTDRQHAARDGELEFFGFQLHVKSPQLAALLTGDDDRVRVVHSGEDVAAHIRPEARDAGVTWRGPRAETGGVVVRLRRLAPDI